MSLTGIVYRIEKCGSCGHTRCVSKKGNRCTCGGRYAALPDAIPAHPPGSLLRRFQQRPELAVGLLESAKLVKKWCFRNRAAQVRLNAQDGLIAAIAAIEGEERAP